MENKKDPTKNNNNNKGGNKGDRSGRSQRPRRRQEAKDGFDQKLVDLARVTRVTKGGKRLSFRACVVIGDNISQVGYGVAKGADVAIAINKAVTQAKKKLITVKPVNGTLPFAIKIKYKAARIMLRPGKQGRGIIAGGVVRTILEMAGYKDVVAKIFGTKNKINNVKATFTALKRLK